MMIIILSVPRYSMNIVGGGVVVVDILIRSLVFSHLVTNSYKSKVCNTSQKYQFLLEDIQRINMEVYILLIVV